MKILTSDLIGAPLNWAVASAMGYLESLYSGEKPRVKLYQAGEHLDSASVCWHPLPDVYYNSEFNPSGSWAVGGYFVDTNIDFLRKQDNGTFVVGIGSMYQSSGPTMLIAAMRCIVLSKLGSEVEIPDELLDKNF